jgi:hypothetical protein
MERMGLDDREALANAIRRVPQRDVATWCSGTDTPVLTRRALDQAVRHVLAILADHRHVFSCEAKVSKQQFLRKMMPGVPRLFSDALKLPSKRAQNIISGKVEDVPDAQEGWTCL